MPKPRRSWLSLLNFLLILTLASAAGYYWWQQQQVARDYAAKIAAEIDEMEQVLAGKAGNARLDSSLSPLKGDIGNLGRKLDELDLVQQELRDSSEKLYELLGRDKNDWQFAEVEYLMRVAQHKLILQDDFEGAAITLQAASDKIGLTGDPGVIAGQGLDQRGNRRVENPQACRSGRHDFNPGATGSAGARAETWFRNACQ